MAFCYLDGEAEKEGFVLVDSLFIEHYLPQAGEAELKVYLLGLDVCRKSAENITLARFAEDLNLSEKEVREAFAYWEKQGLVRVFDEPFSVKYFSVKSRFGLSRTFKKQKYADFNKQVEEIFEGRVVTPQEFMEYYTIIEDGKLEPDAMLLIIKYCLGYCSKENPVRYIRKVASSWVEAGVRTVRDAEDRLMKEDAASQDVRAVLGALGRTSAPDPTDRQLYVKWSTGLGFSKDAILAAAKLAKRKGGMAKLDEILETFAKKGIYTAVDIQEEVKRKDDLMDIAVRVNNKLGLYYQDLNAVVENYAAKWVAQGFSAESLLLIAERCFLDDCRTLSAMDREVQEYFSLGYVSEDAVRARIRELKQADEFMEKIVRMTGGARKVRESDRALYRNWISWGFDENAITEAASIAAGKPYATAYMNQILSNWKSSGRTAPIGEIAAAASSAFDVSGITKEDREKKLRKDKDYAAFEKERRKLSIEIAKAISEGEIPSAEKTRRYDELEKLIAKRKEELGAE
ncbi:MAG: DnaD domain protein [Clostridia bacterium]|nr:DnaD domain protein [Clostridia bacterium]